MSQEKTVQVLFRLNERKRDKIKSIAAANGDKMQRLFEAFTDAYIAGKVFVNEAGEVKEVRND